jgi:rhomboid protease GluP
MQIKHFHVATACIIIVNAVIFAIGLLSGAQIQIIQNYGFIPNHLFVMYDDGNNYADDNVQQNPLSSLLQSSEQQSSASSSSMPDSLTRLFASMFIHANVAHIAFNLFAFILADMQKERLELRDIF